MKILELNHVALHVRDLKVSEKFYREVLLLKRLPRPDFDFPGAWFRLGTEQELHLIGEASDAAISSSRGNHFALRIDEDLAGWETHLRETKADFRPRKQRPDGASQIFVRDPDGHIVELFTGP